MENEIDLPNVGTEFALDTRPTHFFKLEDYARRATPDENKDGEVRWRDAGVGYVACSKEEATHVRGWNSYAAWLTIEDFKKRGILR